MADRKEIREALYSELESAVSAVAPISASDITQEFPSELENLPTIVHSDDHQPMPLNDASAASHTVERDSSGIIEELIYYSNMQSRISLLLLHDNESEKETIYEAVRRHFGKYEHGFADASSINADMHDIGVEASTSADDDDREPTARGDQILITCEWLRDYRFVRNDLATGDEDGTFASEITDVDHLIDADNDGTVDITNTTT